MPRTSIEDQYANLSTFFIRQQRTFVMWCNAKLIEGGLDPIGTGPAAPAAFKDGTVVAHLLQCLTQEAIPGIKWNPGNPMFIQANWSQIFKFMAKEKIELGGITQLSLSQGNQKSCMALLWRFIQKYDLSEPIPGLEGSGGTDGLLKWVKARTDPRYPGVKNFTSNWKDGVAFLALYDSVFPGEIDFATLDQSDNYGNLERAFNLFEEKLGVSQMLSPEDVTGRADTKKGNITYILQIRHAVLKHEANADNLGDKLYQDGLNKMNTTNTNAEETISRILSSSLLEKFNEIGTSDDEYDGVVATFTAELEEVLSGFDDAEESFGKASKEYSKLAEKAEEKMAQCEEKIDKCQKLKEQFRLDFNSKIEDAIRNDRGEKKFSEAETTFPDKVFEGGTIISEVVESVRADFEGKTEDEREAIAAAAEQKIAAAADELFDGVKSLFIEAESMIDSNNRKADCRRMLDEVDASKAQMLETIRIKIAELKAAAGENDELTPEELLQLYHRTTNTIISMVQKQDVVDEGIPSDPAEICNRLSGIIEEVNNIFGSKDTLRAKVHATVDEVFDRNDMP